MTTTSTYRGHTITVTQNPLPLADGTVLYNSSYDGRPTYGGWGSVEAATEKAKLAIDRIEDAPHATPSPVTSGQDIYSQIIADAKRTEGNCHYCGLPLNGKPCTECV